MMILMILHRRVHPQLGLGAECGSPVRLAGTKVAILQLQCQGLVMVMVMMILMITNDMIMTISRFEQQRQEFRMWNAKVSGKLQMRKRLVVIIIVMMIIMIMLILTLIICPMMPDAERRGAPSNANVLVLIPMFQ